MTNNIPLFDVFVFYNNGADAVLGFTWTGSNHERAVYQAHKDARIHGYRDVSMVTVKPEGEYEIVRNLMTNKPVLQKKDTPHCCRVDSEAYWSM